MYRTFSSMIALIACILLSFACHAGEEQKAPSPSDPDSSRSSEADAPSSISPAEDKSGNGSLAMIASVNGIVISQEDLDREIGNRERQFRGRLSPDQLAALRPRIKKQVIENLISQQLLLQEAAREPPGIDLVLAHAYSSPPDR